MIHLYVKVHTKTGLRYFGKTESKNPFTYSGSGLYWRRHLNIHGSNNVVTEEVYSFNSINEASNFAITFSTKNNIVASKSWANMKAENAKDGNPKGVNNLQGIRRKPHTEETKRKISESRKGKPGAIHTAEFKQFLSDRMKGENNPCYGRARTQKQIEQIRAIGERPKSEATKQKMREAALRRYGKL